MRIAYEINEENQLEEEKLTIVVKGKKIVISAESINNLLGVINPLPEPEIN